MSLSDAIHKLADRLRSGERVAFTALFEGHRTRNQVIVTFLAVLEMCKLRLIRVFQPEDLSNLFVTARLDALAGLGEKTDTEIKDDYQ